jgi:hypothetical protein
VDKPPALRRLVDLPGVADLEYKALMKPRLAEPEARAELPEIDACVQANFGLTPEQAEAAPRPADWDGIDEAPVPDQVAAFEAAGWDVTDNKRRPLRMLSHFAPALWLAIRGVAGELPFLAEDTKPEGWVSSLQAEAARFRKR